MPAARFYAKVFDHSGATFRRTLSEKEILDLPNIVREVGKPASDVTLPLALPWDDFGYGEADGLNLFDLVKIYAVTEAAPTGALVFQGNITEIESIYETGSDRVAIRIMPIDALLSASLFRDGASFTKSYTGADASDIMADAVAHADTVYGAIFTANLDDAGLSLSLDIDTKRHLEMIQQAASFLTDGWYWRIKPDGTVQLAEYAATADHTFTAGFDADKIDVLRSIMDTENGLRLAWGDAPTYATYTDAGSEAAYGRREGSESDSSIVDSGSADAKGAAYLAANKNPKSKMVVTVNANYPIETILPGDTCKILNLKAGALPSGIRRIVRVEYDGTQATLHLDDVADNYGNELTKTLSRL